MGKKVEILIGMHKILVHRNIHQLRLVAHLLNESKRYISQMQS